MNIRKICPYCGREFTPYQRRQVACRHEECRKAHIKAVRLEREALAAEARRQEIQRRENRRATRRAYDRAHWYLRSEVEAAKKREKRKRGIKV